VTTQGLPSRRGSRPFNTDLPSRRSRVATTSVQDERVAVERERLATKATRGVAAPPPSPTSPPRPPPWPRGKPGPPPGATTGPIRWRATWSAAPEGRWAWAVPEHPQAAPPVLNSIGAAPATAELLGVPEKPAADVRW